MRTIEAIVEKEIRTHIDDIELCQNIVIEGTKDPALYDEIINNAGKVVEAFIKNNIEFIATLATIQDDEEEEPEGDTQPILNIAQEDEDMLRFIEE